jgi:3D (Asp-Asp-Asp) domain-containing protein
MPHLSDLISASTTRIFRVTRRALVLLTVMVAIGANAVGTGRTIEPRSARKASIQNVLQPRLAEKPAAASARLDELLHDISNDEKTPAVASVRESVSAIEPRISEHHTRTIFMEVTAYCACKKCCGPNAIGLTASGKDVTYNDGRFVAADTSVLPFGTKLVIPGYTEKPVEVIDRGSAIKGNKLDVFFASHEDALHWGRQMVRVTVVD